MNATRIRTDHVGDIDLVVSTVPKPTETLERAYARHLRACESQGGATSASTTCYETDVDCNGSTITVTTCCNPGEDPDDCAARHRARVELVEAACSPGT